MNKYSATNNTQAINSQLSPLVSIIVITYNSAKYVLETLESAYTQTYQNIELIISDDCSKDNTVDVCRKWIEENKSRFVRTELITNAINTGISANCNRGLYASNGEWIKFIAGDDILHKNCIEVFVRSTEIHKQTYFFSGAITPFNNTTKYKPYVGNEKYFNLTAKKQLRTLLTKGNFIIGASIFVNSIATKKLGGFDESYNLIEDYPFFIKVCEKGHAFRFINESVVNYRLHDSNTSFNLSPNYIKTQKKIQMNLVPEKLLEQHQYMHYWHNQIMTKHDNLPPFLGKILLLCSPIFILDIFLSLFNTKRTIKIEFEYP